MTRGREPWRFTCELSCLVNGWLCDGQLNETRARVPRHTSGHLDIGGTVSHMGRWDRADHCNILAVLWDHQRGQCGQVVWSLRDVTFSYNGGRDSGVRQGAVESDTFGEWGNHNLRGGLEVEYRTWGWKQKVIADMKWNCDRKLQSHNSLIIFNFNCSKAAIFQCIMMLWTKVTHIMHLDFLLLQYCRNSRRIFKVWRSKPRWPIILILMWSILWALNSFTSSADILSTARLGHPHFHSSVNWI